MYPKVSADELMGMIEEMDTNKDFKIDIDEFIKNFMENSKNVFLKTEGSAIYRGAICLKAQRGVSVSDLFGLLDRISESSLYFPSFMTAQHLAGKNLPSEPFMLRLKHPGLGYDDISATNDEEHKLSPIIPKVAGYIVFRNATGVPIPDPAMLDRNQILNRVVKMCFYDSEKSKFLSGSAYVLAEWSELSTGIWSDVFFRHLVF